MATESLVIQISEKGAKVVSGSIDQIGRSAKASEDAVSSLKRTLGGIAAAIGINELRKQLDTLQNISNKLRLVTSSTQELLAVQGRLFDIAQRTRSGYESTVELYARTARSAKDLGVSQNDLLQVTEAVNQAIQIGGASAQEASAGVQQLGQALASGRLQGDELRSILENMPRLARAISDGLGKNFGELRRLGSEGKLTSQEVFKAIQSQSSALAAEFAKVTPTIGNSLTVLGNAFQKWLGEMDESLGITKTLSSLILTLADNFDTLAKVILGLVAGPAIIWGLATAVRGVAAAFAALSTIILTNPIGALLAAVTTVITLLYNFRDSIVINQEGLVTLGDYMRAFRDVVVEGARTAAKWFSDTLGPAIDNIRALLPAVGQAFIDYIWEPVKWVVNRVIGLFTILPRTLIGAMQDGMEGAIGALKDTVKKDFLGDAANSDFVKDLQARARVYAAARQLPVMNDVDLNKKGRATVLPDPDADKKLKKFQQEYKRLLDQISPVLKAQQDLADAERILNEAVGRGVITRAKANDLLDLYKERLQDQLDPLGAINREMQRQVDLLAYDSKQREVEAQVLQNRQQLLQQGIRLSADDAQQMREQLTAIQALTDARKREEEQLNAIRDPAKEFRLSLAALNTLYDQGKISVTEYNQAVRDLNVTFLETQDTGVAGLTRGLLKLQKDYEDTGKQVEQTITNAFGNLEDALTKFFSTGKLDFKAFADGLVADINRMIVRSLILLPLLEQMGLAPSGGGGLGLPATSGGGSGGFGGVGSLFGALFGGASGALGDALGMSIGGTYGSATQAGLDALVGGLTGFATGGSFTVGGMGGVDSQTVAFRASPGERVSISRPGEVAQGSYSAPPITMIIQTPDANSFRKSQGQITTEIGRGVRKVLARNGG